MRCLSVRPASFAGLPQLVNAGHWRGERASLQPAARLLDQGGLGTAQNQGHVPDFLIEGPGTAQDYEADDARRADFAEAVVIPADDLERRIPLRDTAQQVLDPVFVRAKTEQMPHRLEDQLAFEEAEIRGGLVRAQGPRDGVVDRLEVDGILRISRRVREPADHVAILHEQSIDAVSRIVAHVAERLVQQTLRNPHVVALHQLEELCIAQDDFFRDAAVRDSEDRSVEELRSGERLHADDLECSEGCLL